MRACVHVGLSCASKETAHTHTLTRSRSHTVQREARSGWLNRAAHLHPRRKQTRLGSPNEEPPRQAEMKSHTGQFRLNESCVSQTKKCSASYVQSAFLRSASNGPTCFRRVGESSERAERRCVLRASMLIRQTVCRRDGEEEKMHI